MRKFDAFETIRIISLPGRLDRRRDMQKELERIGLGDDSRVAFADGVLAKTKGPFRSVGEMGVFLAQLNVLRAAAAADESVLILEDDVDFTPAAGLVTIPEDADVWYGGYQASDPSHPETSNIIGAHCMGFNARTVKALVPFLERLLEHDSPPPIDGAYVWFRRQHPDFKSVFADPAVAVQRPSRSDIAELRHFDRIPLLRRPVEIGRTVKRYLLRSNLTFGLREAVVVSIIGVAIATIVAWHYVG